ncbi:MAG: type IX secretion system membrane protein PorP/SprF [Bacteroidales bacterium]
MRSLRIILALILSGPLLSALGQRDPLYSQYMFDKLLVNPAYAGSSNWIVGSLKYRNHLGGIEGAPQTSLFTFHLPLQKKSMGLGVKAVYDQLAVSNSMTLTGIYSFHIGFGGGKLSFGLEGGMVYNLTDYQSLVRYDPIDQSIPETTEAAIAPDASFGIYYNAKSLYVGVAAYHLFNPKRTVPAYDRNQMFQLEKTFYALGGYVIDIGKVFAVEPGFLVCYEPGAPFQVDGFLNFTYAERITLGGAYRTSQAAAVMLKVNVTEGLRIAYSYDLNVSNLANYSSGSHEFMLSYGIKLLPPPARKEVHPRYYF